MSHETLKTTILTLVFVIDIFYSIIEVRVQYTAVQFLCCWPK